MLLPEVGVYREREEEGNSLRLECPIRPAGTEGVSPAVSGRTTLSDTEEEEEKEEEDSEDKADDDAEDATEEEEEGSEKEEGRNVRL